MSSFATGTAVSPPEDLTVELAPPPQARGRRARPAAGAAVALALVAGLVAAGVAASEPSSGSGAARIACADVAQATGLVFQGRYGPTVAKDEGGTIMQRNMGNGAAVGDYDGDGDLDVYLLGQAGERNILYRNDPNSDGSGRRFSDVTEASGTGDLGLGRIAHFADLDGDGLLDLVLLNDADPEGRLPPSRLFRNRGDGTFEDVTKGSGFTPVGYLVGGATAVDVDLDGDLDLFVTMWTMELGGTPAAQQPRGKLPGANRLYRNDGGFRFTDITDEAGLGGLRIDSFSPLFLDFDADADLDLYLPIDHRADRYFENVDGRFSDVSERVGVGHVGNDMGVAVTDVDGNGTLDLFVTNILDPEENFGKKPRGNTLQLVTLDPSTGVRFADAAYDYGVRDTGWGWGTSFVDLDLDSHLDLYAVQGFDEFVSVYSESLFDATSALFLADESGGFARHGEGGCEVPGDQRALIPFDYDRDGDPDLLITQIGLPALLLENRTTGSNSLTIALDGPGGGGSGARIDVTVEGRTSSQLVVHGASYLAGPPLEAIFGLGDAAAADEVRITDVRGASVVLRDVPAGQLLRITLPGVTGTGQ